MLTEVSRFIAEPEALSDSAIVLRGGLTLLEDIRPGVGSVCIKAVQYHVNCSRKRGWDLSRYSIDTYS